MRLFMITAILRRCVHCKLEKVELLANVTGGMKMKETACDLAIVVAVASAYFDQPIVHSSEFNRDLRVWDAETGCGIDW